MFGNGVRGGRSGAGSEGDPGSARRLSSSEIWTWILVAAGVFLRVLEYADNRRLYMDEEDLQQNLVGLAFYDFHTPLVRAQLAAPGFLAIERLMILLPLPFALAARLVPFVCSIASMFLMRSVARRYLAAAAVPIAVGLFAMTDWMLYYSVEIKQYSSDAMLALAVLLLAGGESRSSKDSQLTNSWNGLAPLTVLGAVGVWFSHPLALVLAGVGAYLIGKAVACGDWKRALATLEMSLAWTVNFAGCYWVSQRIVAKDGFLERWWGFAFLPFPPRSLDDLERIFWQLINVFNSPSGVLTPLGVLPSAFIAAGLFLLGAWSLGRCWRGGLILVVSPILISVMVSMLHLYPFHGRLLIFLIPSVHLLVAQGASALGRPGGRTLKFVLGTALLAQPAIDVVWHRLVQKRTHSGFDSHGDLHPDVLDYLERMRWKKRIDETRRDLKAANLEITPQSQDGGQLTAAAP
jgi:hypothetical protein